MFIYYLDSLHLYTELVDHQTANSWFTATNRRFSKNDPRVYTDKSLAINDARNRLAKEIQRLQKRSDNLESNVASAESYLESLAKLRDKPISLTDKL